MTEPRSETANTEQTPGRLCFGGFLLDTDRWTLTDLRSADADEVPLDTRAIKVLAYLVTHRQRIVSKDELFEQVWAHQVVSDNALTQAITRVRRALGEDSRHANQIQTIRNRGYRFVGELESEPPPEAIRKVSNNSRRRWTAALAATFAGAIALTMLAWESKEEAVVPQAGVLPAMGDSAPLVEQLADVQLDIQGLEDDPQAQVFAASISDGLRIALPGLFQNAQIQPVDSVAREEAADSARSRLTGTIFTRGHESVISLELLHADAPEPLWQIQDRRIPSTHSLHFRELLADTLASITRRPVHPNHRQKLREATSNPRTPFELLVRGRQLYLEFNQAANEQAIEHFERALDQQPDWYPAQSSLALSIAARQHRYRLDEKWLDVGRDLARQAVRQSRNAYDAWRALGMVAIEQGQSQLALEYFQTALVLAPDHYPTVYTVGLTLYNMGRVDEAIAVYTRIRDMPFGRAMLMSYLVELGLDEEVDKLNQEPFENERAFALANYSLLYRAAVSGNYDQAREIGESLRSRYPAIEPALLRICAEIEQRAGNAEASVAMFTEAYELDPEDIDAQSRMAEIWLHAGNTTQAEAVLAKLIAQLTEKVHSGLSRWTEMRQIAMAEALRGNVEAALDWRDRAIASGAYSDNWDETDSRYVSLTSHPRFIQQTLKMEARLTQMRSKALDSMLAGAPGHDEEADEEPEFGQ